MRELSTIQSLFTKEQSYGDSIYPKVFIIQSQIDLFEFKHEIFQAIRKWLSLHPLLNTRIKTEDNNLFFEFDFEICNMLNNIKFLKYSNQSIEERANCWKYLLEYELSNKFDLNGPIWRLYIIELGISEYALVFNPHHSITDCRNVFEIIKELLKIIEDYCVFGQSFVENKQFLFEYRLPFDMDLKYKSLKLSFKEIDLPFKSILIPDYLKPTDSTLKVDIKGEFFDENCNLFIKAEDLVKKREASLSRIKFFDISKEDFSKIIQKCQSYRVKLTGYFETLIALSWLQTTALFSKNEQLNSSNIKYMVTANMRPFMDPPLEYSTMGTYAPALLFNIEFDKNNITREEFWKKAKNSSKNLHEFLDHRIFFTPEFLTEREKLMRLMMSDFHLGGIAFYYIITNVGKMTSNEGKIKIIKFYTMSSFVKETELNAIFYNLCTVDGTLCWSISYNSALLKGEVIENLIEQIKFNLFLF